MARILTAVAAIVLICQLIVPPAVGLANNGDFGKLLGRFGLGTESGFSHAGMRYTFQPRYVYQSDFYSSELLVIYPALALNRLLSRDGSFDLRIMGALHGALFLLALYLFLSLLDGVPGIARWVLGAGAVFIFCDVMYVCYFNSFYMDTVAYLFFALAVVFYLRAVRRGRAVDTLLLVVCALAAIMSKPQYALLGLCFASLFWLARDVLFRGRRWVAGVAAAAVLVCTGITFEFFAPRSYTGKNSFNVVFSRILPNAGNVARALAGLNLDDSYRKWIGTHAYSPESRMEDPAFFVPYTKRVPFWRIGVYYAVHPAEAWLAFTTAVGEAGRHREALGNFDAASGLPPLAESRSFALWSNWKRAVFHGHGARFTAAFLLLATSVAALMWVNRRNLPAGAASGVLMLTGMAAMDLVVSALADILDPTRHQLLFFAQSDMLFLTSIWLAGRWWESRRAHCGARTAVLQGIDSHSGA